MYALDFEMQKIFKKRILFFNMKVLKKEKLYSL